MSEPEIVRVPEILESISCESLVIGGGIAGCWTALKLLERGIATVLVYYDGVDRGGRLGSTQLSVGAINTSPILRDDYPSWLDELGRGQVQHSVSQTPIDYLSEELAELTKFDPLKSVEIGVALLSCSGKKLVDILLAHLRENGAIVLSNAWVVKINASETECNGIQYQQDSKVGLINASSIVIASGGYSGLFHGAVKTGTYGSIHARFLQAGGKLSNVEFIFKHGYGQPDLGKLTPTEELPGVEIVDDEGNHVSWLEEELFNGRGTYNHFQAFMTWRKDESKKYFVDFRYCDFHREMKSMIRDCHCTEEKKYALAETYVLPHNYQQFYEWLNSILNGTIEYSFQMFNVIKPLLTSTCSGMKHRIRQIAYFSMGGIMHYGFQTNLKHVFVNGEAMHDYGAHRVGGLPWALYLSAARKIADHIILIKDRGDLLPGKAEVVAKLARFDPDILSKIQLKLFEFIEQGRDETQLLVLRDWLTEQRQLLDQQGCSVDDAYAYLLMAEAVVQSSILRKESRGCFFRSDYSQEDYQLQRMRTICAFDAISQNITGYLVDKSHIFDLIVNSHQKKSIADIGLEKNNAAFFLLKKHIHFHGDKIAVECEGEFFSYSQLNDLVDQYAYYLFSQGLVKGDRVAILLNDSPHWIAIFLACLQLGIIAVPLNSYAKEQDILYFLEDSDAALLITEVHLLSKLDLSQLCNKNNTRIAMLEDIYPLSEGKISRCIPITESTIGFILYTSGSTGRPKGAVHTHGHIEFTAVHFAKTVLRPVPDSKFYSSSRLYFAYGLGNSLTFPLYFGGTSVLTRHKLGADATLDLMRKSKITHFFSIPTIYAQLLAELNAQQGSLPNLQVCVSAGEPMPPMIAQRWVEQSQCQLVDGIGSTEALHIFCCNFYNSDKSAATGKPVSGYKLFILDDNNFSITKPDRHGNLAVSGGSIALCYWNNPDASKLAFKNNLLKTGDCYRLNECNEFVFLGRSDDLFKSSGLWVSTVEVESALKQLEYVADAAMVVFMSSLGTQMTAVFITPNAEYLANNINAIAQDRDSKLSQSINVDLKNMFSHHKLPNYILIKNEFPRTATGKVMKPILRDIAILHDKRMSVASKDNPKMHLATNEVV